MAKNTTQAIIKHFKSLLNNEAVVNALMENDGKLTTPMCKQAEGILNSDGTFREVLGGSITVKAGQCRLDLECSGRDTPSFIIL
ncbi:hypothetical protein VPDG_00066 [Vibrio phage henriette 12B8]|uniref:hypothetical protein n=1 Tax=Vibrio phage henriette 12B8 TaxID=573174 RepID=UPI0002C09C93|nr:hypothetical protein VPDG_00066 [Vibrio phage henriette 12B8]AGG58227.1 hypothetical protein VPDG_00066 [Vibrio phage henriette 12B8]